MQKHITQGIVRILPMAISLWIFWSICAGLDDIGTTLLQLIGINKPWQGSGFVMVFTLLLLIGVAFSVSPIFWLYQQLEKQLLRFPLFKTVYSSIKDMASLITTDNSKPSSRQTVLVKQANGGFIVGFVTASTLPPPVAEALAKKDASTTWVPVLMQLSYQIAGVTTLIKESDLIYVDWPFEEAMRFMLTAGISHEEPQGSTPQ